MKNKKNVNKGCALILKFYSIFADNLIWKKRKALNEREKNKYPIIIHKIEIKTQQITFFFKKNKKLTLAQSEQIMYTMFLDFFIKNKCESL